MPHDVPTHDHSSVAGRTGEGPSSPRPSETCALWISWERHRRSRELSRYADAELVEILGEGPRYVRHPRAIWQTLAVLRRRQPEVVIVQNPSVFLALLAICVRPFFGYRLLVDAHNAAIRPEDFPTVVLQRLQVWVQRRAEATIVTNAALAGDVTRNGGRPFILPDRIPAPPEGIVDTEGREVSSVLLICTFGEDEPVHEFLEAVRAIPDDTRVFVTGSEASIPPTVRASAPEQLVFTGWLPELDYWRLLASVDVVVDLTTREDCLVCGAYEAVAVGQPLVLSDTAALRSYFRRGVVFTRNEPRAIAEALSEALTRSGELRSEMVQFRATLSDEWNRRGEEFIGLVRKDLSRD